MKLPTKGGLAAAVLAATLTLTGCVSPPSTTGVPGSTNSGTCTATGTIPQIPGMSAARQTAANTNAQAIAAAVAELGLPFRATEIATVVALTESTMENIGYGDIQNGSMTTSRGLYQQLAAWITPGANPDPRLDPKEATKMFLLGGARGQKGLTQVAGWATMDIPTAAQTVQQSEFNGITKPFAQNFKTNLDLGLRIAAAVNTKAPACTAAGPGSVLANGVNVTIPSNQYVVEALRGKVIQAPNAGVAKGLAAGFSQLGLPYVWGGGGDGAAANNGCARGGGSKNSCGAEIGFDCSGLTAYVIVQGGFPSPGGESGSQRAGGTSVAYSAGIAGDIVGFPGHVAIFLGTIEGKMWILEASDVGTPIHVVELRRSDRDPSLHRYWKASTA